MQLAIIRALLVALADKLDREEPAEQIFWTTHTTLAFDRDMADVIHKIEENIGMNNIFRGFLVEVGIDHKQDSVSLASIKWVLNLFGFFRQDVYWNIHNR